MCTKVGTYFLHVYTISFRVAAVYSSHVEAHACLRDVYYTLLPDPGLTTSTVSQLPIKFSTNTDRFYNYIVLQSINSHAVLLFLFKAGYLRSQWLIRISFRFTDANFSRIFNLIDVLFLYLILPTQSALTGCIHTYTTSFAGQPLWVMNQFKTFIGRTRRHE